MTTRHGWLIIARLALVQAAIGAIIVLTTSTLNRIMVVELALPATLPSAMIAIYYSAQLTRPRFGHGSDVGMRRTPWIVGGMLVLATGAVLAAAATALMQQHFVAGLALCTLAFATIGAGTGAASTALLTLSATVVSPPQRGPAATAMFTMMIAGFVVTTSLAARFLEPFTMLRLVAVTATVGVLACLAGAIAIRGLEGPAANRPKARRGSFGPAFAQAWREPSTRRFAFFIFISMLAYSGQDMVLEPFGGLAFGLTPAETTRLSAWQNGGILGGMLAVALAGGLLGRRHPGTLRLTAVLGAALAALCLVVLAAAPALALGAGLVFPLAALLGFGLGAFTISAIGAMMAMADAQGDGRAGLRMGLWGAAQALAFGVGGLVAGMAVDLVALATGTRLSGYSAVFAAEAALFVLSAVLAVRAIQLRPDMADAAFRTGAVHHKAA